MTSTHVGERMKSLVISDNAIRGEIALPILDLTDATDEDAGIPDIIANGITDFGQLPAVVQYHQAGQKAKAIERLIQGCREQIGELADQQASSQDIDVKLKINTAIRSRQAELETLQTDAAFTSDVLRTAGTQAREVVLSASRDRLERQRSDMGQAANAAQNRAMELLGPVAALIESIADSPEAEAAIEAAADARRTTAAKRILNTATDRVIEEVLAGLELA